MDLSEVFGAPAEFVEFPQIPQIPPIPQITAVFGECCGRVRRAGLRVVAASLFLPD